MRDVPVKGEKQFTASVWLITKTKPKKALLIHHKKHNKWLQPGGHIEKFENPIEAAAREVKEETGLDISFIKSLVKVDKQSDSFLPLPTFFMEQRIPKYKDEPEHFHLDMQYVVEVEEQRLIRSLRESYDIGWFTKKEALKLKTHENTKTVIKKFM